MLWIYDVKQYDITFLVYINILINIWIPIIDNEEYSFTIIRYNYIV